MQKPIKPTKPSKTDTKPEPLVTHAYTLGVNVKNQNPVLMLDETLNLDTNVSTDFEKGVPFILLEKVAALVGEDFLLCQVFDYDGYYESTQIHVKVENLNFLEKLAIYNNRFTKYQQDLLQYKKDLKAYEAYQHEQKIVKQKKRIQKLEEELKRLQL